MYSPRQKSKVPAPAAVTAVQLGLPMTLCQKAAKRLTQLLPQTPQGSQPQQGSAAAEANTAALGGSDAACKLRCHLQLKMVPLWLRECALVEALTLEPTPYTKEKLYRYRLELHLIKFSYSFKSSPT